MVNEEFNNGWTAAERDEMSGIGERVTFPPYRTAEFISGYSSFWEARNLEIADAEANAINDYDCGPGYRYRNFPMQG